MKKPNTFIIGAPKCGTTSLANWLAEHPQVYHSPIKEPRYFNYDYGFRRPMTLQQYERLFAGADERHHAVVEATPRYLYSHTAVPAILAYADDPRFVVMLRNPVDMAPSLHEQTLLNGNEVEPDFERAWRLQGRRLYGENLPKGCQDPQLLQYGSLCKLGEQLERLYKLVPRERVHVIRLERMSASPRTEWLRLQAFLKVEDDGRMTFPVANTAKARRFPWLIKSVAHVNSFARGMGVPYIRTGLTELLNTRLVKHRPRKPISPELRKELVDYFSKDLCLLNQLEAD